MRLKTWMAVMALAVLAAGGWALWRPAARPDAPPLAGSMAGFQPATSPAPAPDISFSDEAGNSLSLADFRGRLVVLNLWATWCAPCVKELPSLDRLAAEAGPGIAVVALSIDRGGMAEVGPFLAEHGIKTLTPSLDPSSAVLAALGARGLPTTYLIGPDGTLLGRKEGDADWASPETKALLAYYGAAGAD
jgi:thiol-disulfide isomerase/thioredoxin